MSITCGRDEDEGYDGNNQAEGANDDNSFGKFGGGREYEKDKNALSMDKMFSNEVEK